MPFKYCSSIKQNSCSSIKQNSCGDVGTKEEIEKLKEEIKVLKDMVSALYFAPASDNFSGGPGYQKAAHEFEKTQNKLGDKTN